MSNFLIAIAVFVITVVAALFAIPYAVDWNGYRGVFEEEASRMLGREVRVGGNVNLHFLPTPYFSLERVRIADAAGGLQEPFFRTDGLTIKLAIPPLLRGAIEANEVELRRPVVRLAVDEKGGWNWQGFVKAFSNAAYMPTSVSITSLVVTDGMLALHGADGQERTRFEGIRADLSAPSLQGPYRVRALYGAKGSERELRLATAQPEEDGSVRIKASVRASDSAASYGVEARVLNLMSNVRLEGEMTARLPFSGLWPTETRAVSDEAFELRSKLRADADRVALDDLSLSFEQDGQPQSLTGELTAQWRKALNLDVRLASRWLDFDRIGGVKTVTSPADSILPFARRLRDLLPQDGRSRARLAVEQAKLGNEAVSGLSLALTKADGRVSVDELRAALPGGSRLEIAGQIAGGSDDPRFSGSLNVRGTSLARFASWASGGLLPSEGRADGTFGLYARVEIEPGALVVRDAKGEISGNAVGGSGSFRWGQSSEIGLKIEGPQLDVRSFVPAGTDLSDLAALLSSSGDGSLQLGKSDLALRISTGALLTAGATYRDVSIEIERKAGTLKVPMLRLSGDDGFSLDLEGEIATIASRPKGNLRVVAAADTAAALTPLALLLGIPTSLRPGEARFQSLAPLRVAGTMVFGGRLPGSIDIAADGEANGGALRLAARLDGGTSGWKSGPADLLVSVENADAQQVAALLLPQAGAVTGGAARAQTPEAGRILLRAAGVPAQGMPVLFSLTANETALAFTGRFTASQDAPRLVGDLDLAGADGARIAALARLSPPLRLGSFPVSGTLRIATDGSTVNVERLSLDIAGARLLGRLGLAPEGDKQRVNAELHSEALSLAQVLTPALDNRLGAATAAAEAVLNARSSVWPDQPFDARAIAGLVADVSLKANRLAVGRDLSLSDAHVRVRIGDGRILVRELDGLALGARWSSAFTIVPQPGGAEITGTMQASDIALSQISPDALGLAGVKASFKGRGTSPRALLATLEGQGSIQLRDAAVSGVSPAAVSKAVDGSLKGGSESLLQSLRQGMLANLSKPPLPLPADITAEISDGVLRVKPLSIETNAGTAAGGAAIDLASLTFASDWRLTDKVLSNNGRPLPAVTVHYKGSLGAVGRLEPEIGAEALEREVAVRKMERDVDELERLRKLDEARRREEAERLKEQAERAPPPAAQPAQQQPPANVQQPQPQQQPRPQAQQKAPSLKSLLPPWLLP